MTALNGRIQETQDGTICDDNQETTERNEFHKHTSLSENAR